MRQFVLGARVALLTAGLLVQIIKPADTRDIFWCAAAAFNTLMLRSRPVIDQVIL